MMRGLVLLGGISDHEYMREQVASVKSVHKNLIDKYGACHIHTIDYQPLMDKHAILFKSLLDPARLVLNPNGWRAQAYVEGELKRLCKIYDQVDVISHSLGNWLVSKCNVKLNNLYMIANPIGFCTLIGRNIVRLDIGTPKVTCNSLFYAYSKQDLVSCKPPEITKSNRWGLKSNYLEVIETGTHHDVTKYLTYINGKFNWFSPYST